MGITLPLYDSTCISVTLPTGVSQNKLVRTHKSKKIFHARPPSLIKECTRDARDYIKCVRFCISQLHEFTYVGLGGGGQKFLHKWSSERDEDPASS